MSSGTIRLALLETEPISVSMSLTDVVRTLVRQSSRTAAVVDERLVESLYAGGDFRFRVDDLQVPDRQDAALLDSRGQIALVFPPDPSFVAAMKAGALDPESFGQPWTVALSSRAVSLSCAQGPQGEALISVLVNPNEEPALWKRNVAYFMKVRWGGKDLSVLIAGRVFGQLGRVATVLEKERAKGPLLVVARGDLFSPYNFDPAAKEADTLREFERLGLRYSAVGEMELTHWKELQDYRASGSSLTFLSANLVYSTAPAVSLFPSIAVVRFGDLRVGLIGLTPPSAARSLAEVGLSGVTIQDPLAALRARMPALRREADVVIALMDATRDFQDILSRGTGVDVVVGRSVQQNQPAPLPESEVRARARPDYAPPLWVMNWSELSVDLLEADVTARRASADWDLRERHVLLDDSVEAAPGYAQFDPENFGITFSSQTPLLPAARELHPPEEGPERGISARDFWSLAASLAAWRSGAEASLLRVWPLRVTIAQPVPESVVKVWLADNEPAVELVLKGRDLKRALAQADAQRQAEAEGQPEAALPFTYGGVGADQKIHGIPIEDDVDYKVLTTQALADALSLTPTTPPQPAGTTADALVLEALKAEAGAPPDRVRAWTQGRPVEKRGLWRVNFRDIGLNLQDTNVVRSDAFDSVPNSRIQGFNQVLIGGELKTDAEYILDPLRWSNTLELEYAKSRLHPRGQDAVTNVTANRIEFLTTGTRRAGEIPQKWLAQSWGPSLGFEFDSQFEPDPGLPRKQVYSAYPGVQFYDGTWVKSLEASANIKRDMSRIPPNTQTGLHGRVLVARDIATASNGPISLQGEVYSNYFFLTHSDTLQDLRVEGDANLKLRVPFRKYLSIAPFVDFYWFSLKVQPDWGYSVMTGIQIGFSRLWKPQYQPLFGER